MGKRLLTITESEDGMVTGWRPSETQTGKYEKVFCGPMENLFRMLLSYGKEDEINMMALGQEMSGKFMEKYVETPVFIWRRNVRSFMSFGKGPERVGIWLMPADLKENRYGIEKAELHKGFEAIVIPTGKAAGVYELESGGLIGNTVEQVNEDIDACDDVELMKQQIADCIKERDSGVCNISLEDFGIDLKYENRKGKENE